jgi:hypothetical protein
MYDMLLSNKKCYRTMKKRALRRLVFILLAHPAEGRAVMWLKSKGDEVIMPTASPSALSHNMTLPSFMVEDNAGMLS